MWTNSLAVFREFPSCKEHKMHGLDLDQAAFSYCFMARDGQKWLHWAQNVFWKGLGFHFSASGASFKAAGEPSAPACDWGAESPLRTLVTGAARVQLWGSSAVPGFLGCFRSMGQECPPCSLIAIIQSGQPFVLTAPGLWTIDLALEILKLSSELCFRCCGRKGGSDESLGSSSCLCWEKWESPRLWSLLLLSLLVLVKRGHVCWSILTNATGESSLNYGKSL